MKARDGRIQGKHRKEQPIDLIDDGPDDPVDDGRRDGRDGIEKQRMAQKSRQFQEKHRVWLYMVDAVAKLKPVPLEHNVLNSIQQSNKVRMEPEVHPLVIDSRSLSKLLRHNAILRPQGQLQHKQCIDHIRRAQVKEKTSHIATSKHTSRNLLCQSLIAAVLHRRIEVSA